MLTNEDYIEIQDELRKINIDSLLKDYYGDGQGLAGWGDFYGRATMGIRGALIDAEKGLFPSTHLEKIGNGGNRCVVTFGTLNGNYGHFVRSLSKGLKATGFDGYLRIIGLVVSPILRDVRSVMRVSLIVLRSFCYRKLIN